jgi:uncharacterized protein
VVSSSDFALAYPVSNHGTDHCKPVSIKKSSAIGDLLSIEVVFGPAAGPVELVSLHMPPESTVADALAASGLLQQHPELGASPAVGVWGSEQPLTHRLRDGDRVEIYRPLQVDPKEARRLRYRARRA